MNWENISEGKYIRYVYAGDSAMELRFNKNKSYYEGECTINGAAYTISRKGFWKTNISLENEKGIPVAILLQEKWHSRKWRLQIDGFNYYVRYQNNPLFELIVEDYAADTVIKYKLFGDAADTSVELQVLTKPEHPEHLDYIILLGWYLVLPICIEHTVEVDQL